MKAIWTLYSKQIIVTIIAIVVLVIVILALANKKGDGKGDKPNPTNATPESWDAYLKNPPPGSPAKSYPLPQYKNWADQLESAMIGPGTNEDQIFSIHNQLNNDADYAELQRAFGVREYSTTVLIWAWWEEVFTSPVSLANWITSDLGEEEISELNQILISKGITFRY